jgi:hypothetical protein
VTQEETQDYPRPRKKYNYIGAPAVFALELALRHVTEAYNCTACYIVGSALERPNWRDVDVRMIMDDEDFAKNFPDAEQHPEHDAKWLLLTVAISEWLSKQSGLPVDFQFQAQTHANDYHKGTRNAAGFRLFKEKRED